MATVVTCAACGNAITYDGLVGRRDECPKCHADLHACKNCQHYDPAAYNECKEPQADRVQEKDRSNFCDDFTPRSGGASAANKQTDKQADKQKDLKAAAEALFKKKT